MLAGRYLQVWQLGAGYAAEGTLEQACDTAITYGFQGLLWKALDGASFPAVYLGPGRSRDDIGSMTQVGDQKAYCESRGLKYAVWVVPKFGDDIYLDRQAELYAQLAGICGGVVLDFEPYWGFWGANRPEGSGLHLMARLRQQAPDSWNVLQPDPRAARLAELNPAELFAHTNQYAPQVYWTDFQQDPTSVIADAIGTAAYYGVPLAATLPGNAEPEELAGAMEQLYLAECPAVIVWRLGTTAPVQLSVVGNGPLWSPPTLPTACERLTTAVRAELARPNRHRSWRRLAGALEAT